MNSREEAVQTPSRENATKKKCGRKRGVGGVAAVLAATQRWDVQKVQIVDKGDGEYTQGKGAGARGKEENKVVVVVVVVVAAAAAVGGSG